MYLLDTESRLWQFKQNTEPVRIIENVDDVSTASNYSKIIFLRDNKLLKYNIYSAPPISKILGDTAKTIDYQLYLITDKNVAKILPEYIIDEIAISKDKISDSISGMIFSGTKLTSE